ncbi:MAG: hypothetical protein ACK6EB_31995, partial [Planctomyces sp.]
KWPCLMSCVRRNHGVNNPNLVVFTVESARVSLDPPERGMLKLSVRGQSGLGSLPKPKSAKQQETGEKSP